MTIGKLMEELGALKDEVGEDKEIVFVCRDGENDIYTPGYAIAGDFTDCNGDDYSCAMIIHMESDEFTKRGIPHYNWNPQDYKVN